MRYFQLNDLGGYQLLVLYFDKKMIIWKESALYTQDQGRVAERFICTIIKKARTMLIYADFASKLWLKALSTAYYITNKLFTKVL